jgi:hypothetical protein
MAKRKHYLAIRHFSNGSQHSAVYIAHSAKAVRRFVATLNGVDRGGGLKRVDITQLKRPTAAQEVVAVRVAGNGMLCPKRPRRRPY